MDWSRFTKGIIQLLRSGSLGSREKIGNIVLGKWIYGKGEIFMTVLTKDLGIGSIAFGRVCAHDLNCLYLHRDYSVGVRPVYCLYSLRWVSDQWKLHVTTWRLLCRCLANVLPVPALRSLRRSPARIFPLHLPDCLHRWLISFPHSPVALSGLPVPTSRLLCRCPASDLLVPALRSLCRCPARIFPSHLPDLSTQVVG
ncbi:hypothetical protein L3X38_031812 [Prunus dulcis]|uniref:Uncharacterized protein n=1 Tax=Prunus dulcis TaxID=3755 RepID=A0AAD4VCW8_PRUDU|nr:hypothetical protein L3X38_031812 [Prunus dulcis]